MSGAVGFKVWLEAARPKTLSAAVVPVMVGTALAHASAPETARLWLGFFAALSALFIQIGTNLINDALDFKKGADTEKRIGPRRVTQSGLLSPEAVLRGGFACFALASALALPLVYFGGWTIVGIGLASLVLGYLYTGGPFPLAYVGLGELFVILFFGIVAVGGVYFVETGLWDLKALLAGTQVGLFSTVLIAINNLRDAPGDREVGKMTLAARFGKLFGRVEIATLIILPFILGIFWLNLSPTIHPAFIPFALLPLSVRLVVATFKIEPGPRYNQLLALSSVQHMLFGLLLSAAFLA